MLPQQLYFINFERDRIYVICDGKNKRPNTFKDMKPLNCVLSRSNIVVILNQTFLEIYSNDTLCDHIKSIWV